MGNVEAQAGRVGVEVVQEDLKKEGLLGEIELCDDGITLSERVKKTSPLTEWLTEGSAKICVYVDSEEELLSIAEKARDMHVLTALITDAGMTEFHGEPTLTCLAIEPLPSEVADQITGGLPLY
ncbi:MAG: peptidyl-tRNA hydrolase [Clostridia bacterium]|nr:peptidyl-tRNA hydrolase [Clostridia bacterium]